MYSTWYRVPVVSYERNDDHHTEVSIPIGVVLSVRSSSDFGFGTSPRSRRIVSIVRCGHRA